MLWKQLFEAHAPMDTDAFFDGLCGPAPVGFRIKEGFYEGKMIGLGTDFLTLATGREAPAIGERGRRGPRGFRWVHPACERVGGQADAARLRRRQ